MCMIIRLKFMNSMITLKLLIANKLNKIDVFRRISGKKCGKNKEFSVECGQQIDSKRKQITNLIIIVFPITTEKIMKFFTTKLTNMKQN